MFVPPTLELLNAGRAATARLPRTAQHDTERRGAAVAARGHLAGLAPLHAITGVVSRRRLPRPQAPRRVPQRPRRAARRRRACPRRRVLPSPLRRLPCTPRRGPPRRRDARAWPPREPRQRRAQAPPRRPARRVPAPPRPPRAQPRLVP